jgi:transposase
MVDVMLGMIDMLGKQIALLNQEIGRRAREEDAASRLMIVLGVGPITATALTALAPAAETFRGARFCCLARPNSVAEVNPWKTKARRQVEDGERTLRRLLIIGASALVRQTSRRPPPAGSWLAQMLARKPRLLVIVDLANKMARVAWALLVRSEVYRAHAAA